MSSSEMLNPMDGLEAVYDDWYLRMFTPEQGGERLEREISSLVTLLPKHSHRRVVDFGSGFGRISNSLAARGYDVVGIELNDSLRRRASEDAAARGVAVRYISGSWFDYRPTDPAAAVLLWGTTYGHQGDTGDRSTLRSAYEMLDENGVLLIELRNWGAPSRSFDNSTHRVSGDAHLFEVHSFDIVTSVQTTRQVVVDGGRVVTERVYRLRRYSAHEIVADCVDAGFARVDVFDASGNPASELSERIVVRATRAQPRE